MAIGKILGWAEAKPDSLALVSRGLALSYRQLVSAVGWFQARLRDAGIDSSGVLAIVSNRLLETWLMAIAARSLGLDTTSVVSLSQLSELQLSNLRCVVLERDLTSAGDAQGHVAAATDRVALPDVSEVDLAGAPVPILRSKFGGHILHTTGTTGTPKKVFMCGQDEEARNAYRSRRFSYNAKTVLYTNLFPFTGAGFKGPSAVWHAGGAVVLDEDLNIDPHLSHYPISSILCGSRGLERILDRSSLETPADRELEVTFTAGPLSLGLARRTAQRLTPTIRVYYGATEILGAALTSEFHDKNDLIWLTPEEGRCVRVVDRAGHDCRVGEEGELAVELLNLDARSYLGDSESSRSVFRNGFYFPGDLAVRRSDGRIRILGRLAHVINIRGVKKPVSPIEHAIQSLLRVDEVCLFSELNHNGEDEVVVAVRTPRTLTDAETDQVAEMFLTVDRVRFVVLPRFPRSYGGFGKTLRRELRMQIYGKSG